MLGAIAIGTAVKHSAVASQCSRLALVRQASAHARWPLQSGLGRSDLPGGCRQAPIPDLGRLPEPLSGGASEHVLHWRHSPQEAQPLPIDAKPTAGPIADDRSLTTGDGYGCRGHQEPSHSGQSLPSGVAITSIHDALPAARVDPTDLPQAKGRFASEQVKSPT